MTYAFTCMYGCSNYYFLPICIYFKCFLRLSIFFSYMLYHSSVITILRISAFIYFPIHKSIFFNFSILHILIIYVFFMNCMTNTRIMEPIHKYIRSHHCFIILNKLKKFVCLLMDLFYRFLMNQFSKENVKYIVWYVFSLFAVNCVFVFALGSCVRSLPYSLHPSQSLSLGQASSSLGIANLNFPPTFLISPYEMNE